MDQTCDTGLASTGCALAACRMPHRRTGGGPPQQFADRRAVDTWQYAVPQYSDDNRLAWRDVRQPAAKARTPRSSARTALMVATSSSSAAPRFLILRIAVAAAFTVASVPSGKGRS
jgi:hypothetical protein